MKLSQKAKKLIDANCLCILRGMGKGGSSGRWPMPVLKTTNEASIFSEPVIAQKFYERVKSLESKYKSVSRISKIIPYPSPLARLTMIFRSRKIWQLNQVQQIEMANILAEILYNKYQTNHFCQHGKNILWSNKEQKDNFTRLKKARKYLMSSSVITRLNGRLWLYAEMIYSRWHNLGHEFHGPYTYNKNEKLLVKEWHDLQGLGWPVFKNFPYKKIICYEFYKNNSIYIDIHNRLATSKPLAQTLTRSYVEIDGKLADEKRNEKVVKALNSYLSKGEKYLASRSKIQLKKINAVMEFYSIKPLADGLGEDWKPSQKLLNDIEKGKLNKEAKDVLARLSYYYPRINKSNVRILWNPSFKFS
ncbi:hypothetical protein CO134_01435 [Candidatus Kuenenbacteria bacterium CG_4_9_14_3_um_filter_39_14]|uniref:Uncharacterized protein n=6 Tax=Candidatus Kueneniibacteriota TaxID=1752740 RepID=A0A2M7ILH3_9BACT|nr:MAG: hypothetical protein COX28_02625 [Candidatus Kuenenbacteria bacterium CG23_combo_of_CG06-09_8_20_14_all_39_39]PIP75682.1 MAG: hypothetical protein COW86_02390 [Candidatus Kuenenbacteria bacterium CG22_combo_CG10-13_8_21_14_all_39_9]PIR81122.1 MAG: hypothetical protein COU24_00370 [Candidatus Kuenenbacteria bacterium CG10_big_fil_rev_8_21_14_0_10_39_14]PIW95695.1 MAG: hypothetical protein COZ84_02015 [Candidatus Kuenenbacteria bacterium CG_4_8_14_3_um_filter_39_15]PIX92226.1 MAG: hypothe